MRKVLVLGNSGSGKTTLSNSIARDEGLAHLDLDGLAWLPKTPPERSPLSAAKLKVEQFIEKNRTWVIEGCYTDLLEIAAAEANEVILMNLGTDQCIENAKSRPWEPHKYSSKTEQDKNLTMLIDWIAQYTERNDVFSYESHMRFYNGFQGKKSMFTHNVKLKGL